MFTLNGINSAFFIFSGPIYNRYNNSSLWGRKLEFKLSIRFTSTSRSIKKKKHRTQSIYILSKHSSNMNEIVHALIDNAKILIVEI